ncbi:MAG: class I SAM-dependent methyltransferase, partial [Eubacteriales bacterium]
KKAYEIVSKINYDFSRLHIQKKTNTMMCMRAGLLDEVTEKKLAKGGETLVLHLGCGLDSRCLRVKQSAAAWYDVDFPEVIALRKNFFAETKTYHMIGSSVTEAAWIESIPNTGFDSVLVLAEGMMMYLKEAAVKTLISRLKARFKTFDLVMDVYNTMAANGAAHHPSLKKTGVKEFWGFDDPKLLETWGLGLTHIQTLHFAEYHLERLPAFDRMLYGLVSRIKVARNAHRVEEYRC